MNKQRELRNLTLSDIILVGASELVNEYKNEHDQEQVRSRSPSLHSKRSPPPPRTSIISTNVSMSTLDLKQPSTRDVKLNKTAIPKMKRSRALSNISRKSSIRGESIRSMGSTKSLSSISSRSVGFAVRTNTNNSSNRNLSNSSRSNNIIDAPNIDKIEKQDTSKLGYQISQFIIILKINETLFNALLTKYGKFIGVKPRSLPISKKNIKYLGILCLLMFITDYVINVTFGDSIIFTTITKIVFITGILNVIFMCNNFVFKEACKSFVVWYKLFHSLVAASSRMVYYDWWFNHDFIDLKSTKEHAWIYVLNAILYIIIMVLGTFCSIVLIDGYHFDRKKNNSKSKSTSPTSSTTSTTSTTRMRNNTVSYFGIIIAVISFTMQYIELYFNLYGYDLEKSLNIRLFGQIKTYQWRAIAMSSYGVVVIFFAAELYSLYYYPNALNVVPLPATLNKVSLMDENNVLQNFFNVVDTDKQHAQENTTTTTTATTREHNYDDDEWLDAHDDFDLYDENEIRNDFFNKQSSVVSKSNSQRRYHLENILTVGIDIDWANSESNKFDDISQMCDKYIINIPVEFTLFYMVLNKIFKYKHTSCVRKVTYFRRKMPFIVRMTNTCAFLRFSLSFWGIISDAYGVDIIYEIISRLILDIFLFIGFVSVILNANYALICYKCATLTLLWKLYGLITMYIAQYLVCKLQN